MFFVGVNGIQYFREDRNRIGPMDPLTTQLSGCFQSLLIWRGLKQEMK